MASLRWRLLLLVILADELLSAGAHAENVRMCGRRLADLLNFICERHGGFHAPKVKRTGETRSTLIEILRPLSSRNTDEAEDSSWRQGGVVDECCRKPCSLNTLASYCASPAGHITLEDIISASQQETNESANNEGDDSHEQRQHQAASAAPAPSAPQVLNLGDRGRPNLGLFSRNRPVFIVLSQLQEDDEHFLGEYRF